MSDYPTRALVEQFKMTLPAVVARQLRPMDYSTPLAPGIGGYVGKTMFGERRVISFETAERHAAQKLLGHDTEITRRLFSGKPR